MIGKKVKIVYEDGDNHKVVKGKILDINEYEYKILGYIDNKEMIIGKRGLIQITEIN